MSGSMTLVDVQLGFNVRCDGLLGDKPKAIGYAAAADSAMQVATLLQALAHIELLKQMGLPVKQGVEDAALGLAAELLTLTLLVARYGELDLDELVTTFYRRIDNSVEEAA